MVKTGLKEPQSQVKIINISSLNKTQTSYKKNTKVILYILNKRDCCIVSIYHLLMIRYLSETLISETLKMLYKFYFIPLYIIQEMCVNNYHSFVTLVLKRSIECLPNGTTGRSSEISLSLETQHNLKVEKVPFKAASLSIHRFLKVWAHPKQFHD